MANEIMYQMDKKMQPILVSNKFPCSFSFLFSSLQYYFLFLTASGTYKRDPHAFLFHLSGLTCGPKKIDLIEGQEGSSIYCCGSQGPVFGMKGTSGYHDLFINNAANAMNTCSSYLGTSYKIPEGVAYNTCAGSQMFNLTEMEVYVFEK